MKKLIALIAFAAVLGTAPAFAHEQPSLMVELNAITQVSALDVINWKVGDTANYNMGMMSMPLGTMVMSVTKDEGTALWMKQDASMMGQAQVIETLISKADGKILKMIQNGKEVQVPDDKIEIVSQDYTEVTVPAGTFKALHVVANTKDAQGIQIWVNPRDTVMSGMLKQVVPTQGMEISMELTSFKHGQ